MKRHGTIVAEAATLLGFLLLTGSGTALAAESPWTDWKENLPFRLSAEERHQQLKSSTPMNLSAIVVIVYCYKRQGNNCGVNFITRIRWIQKLN